MKPTISATGILDSLGAAVIVCDADLKVRFVNAAAEHLLGMSRRGTLGRPLERTFLNIDALREPVGKALSDGGQITLRETELSSAERTMMLDVTVSRLDWENQSLVVLELNRIDRIARLAKETDQLDRQQTYRLMLRSLAHEIKNPLGGLRGAAQLLDREISSRELREYTRIMVHEADRLTSLVDRIMGSPQPLKRERVNIHRVLEHVAKLILADSGAGLNLVRDYDPSLPAIVGDSELLIQVILNVVKNGVEAQQGKGLIGLRSRIEYMFTIGTRTHRQVLRIQIWDHGPGVPPELRDRVFDPMISGRAEGTGLGLSIAQDIVQRHGGLIELENYKGNTCFTIYLPLGGRPENGGRNARRAPESSGSKL